MSDGAASLAAFAERLRGSPKTVTTYGPRDYEALRALLSRFDVALAHCHLPIPESTGYLTVREGESFLGAVSTGALDELLDPPRSSPWDPETRASAFRDLTSLLAGTTFRASDRRHLLATAREFEDRAARVGRGALRVGFQSLSAFRAQLPVYERLAAETDLSIAVYGEPDWVPPEAIGVTVHTAEAGELGTYWIVAFDGDGNDGMACALLAEETASGEYEGTWTYDPEVVRDLVTYLDLTDGE